MTVQLRRGCALEMRRPGRQSAGMPTTLAPPRPPMERMLESLPAQYRQILVETYFRGRSPREAAKALGIPPAVATARLYQAMRDLSLMITVSGTDDTSWRPV